jgi:hypothetical protein
MVAILDGGHGSDIMGFFMNFELLPILTEYVN